MITIAITYKATDRERKYSWPAVFTGTARFSWLARHLAKRKARKWAKEQKVLLTLVSEHTPNEGTTKTKTKKTHE